MKVQHATLMHEPRVKENAHLLLTNPLKFPINDWPNIPQRNKFPTGACSEACQGFTCIILLDYTGPKNKNINKN